MQPEFRPCAGALAQTPMGVGVILPPGFAIFRADIGNEGVGKLGGDTGVEAKEVVVGYNIVETLESGCGGYIAASFSRTKMEEVVVVDFVVVAAANGDIALAIDEGVVAEDVLVALDAEKFVFTIARFKEVVFNKGSDVPPVAVVAV